MIFYFHSKSDIILIIIIQYEICIVDGQTVIQIYLCILSIHSITVYLLAK